MPRAALILALFLAACAHPPAGTKARSHEAPPSARQVREWMGDECVRSGKRVGIDYPRALNLALRQDPAGLAELFRYTDVGEMDGGAGEAHAAVLYGLLQRWGDTRYAEVLRRQTPRIRKAVVGNLPMPPESEREYPLTQALAPR